MPNHTPDHMARLARASAAQRRADKVARLIVSAPPFSEAQAARLRSLLEERIATARGTR